MKNNTENTQPKGFRVIFSFLLALLCGLPLGYWCYTCVSELPRYAGESPWYANVVVVFVVVFAPLGVAIAQYYRSDDTRQGVESKIFRLCVFALALIVGLVLWCHTKEFVRDFFEAGGSGISDRLSWYAEGVMLGIFVVTALWFFRTYDIRQQIAQTNKQIEDTVAQNQQSNFLAGIEMLGKRLPREIAVGTRALTKFKRSDLTNEFVPEIERTFIDLLKEPPTAPSGKSAAPSGKSAASSGESAAPGGKSAPPKFTHAQYMFKWLQENSELPITELCTLDLSYQQFRKEERVSMRTIVKVCDPLMSRVKVAHIDCYEGFFDIGNDPTKTANPDQWIWRASGT